MKRIFTFLHNFFLVTVCLSGQVPFKLSTKENTYLAGDSLYKYQVEYKDPGSIGKKLEWDFSNLRILNDNYLIKYFYPDKRDSFRICGMEHRTRYYYQQRNDTLWATGFENYTTMIKYTVPELKLKFPFVYGDTLYSLFEGEGIYSNMFPLKVRGYTRTKADAEGVLKLPDGKEISDVLRLYSIRHYTETGRDSLQMTLETYSWYARGIRYPVFESIKTKILLYKTSRQNEKKSVMKDTTIFCMSFYYTPEELISDEEENEKKPEIERVFTEVSMLPNPIESDLQINYNLTRPALIRFSVHNNIGIPMRITTQRNLPAGNHEEIIPMKDLITGTYTVYIHVDDMVMNRVVVKR